MKKRSKFEKWTASVIGYGTICGYVVVCILCGFDIITDMFSNDKISMVFMLFIYGLCIFHSSIYLARIFTNWKDDKYYIKPEIKESPKIDSNIKPENPPINPNVLPMPDFKTLNYNMKLNTADIMDTSYCKGINPDNKNNRNHIAGRKLLEPVELEEKVVEMYKSNIYSIAEIIMATNIYRNKLYKILKDYNVPLKVPVISNSIKKQIAELHNDGHTIAEIEKITNTSNHVVRSEIYNANLSEKKLSREIVKRNRELVVELYKNGNSAQEIINITGLSYGTVLNKIAHYRKANNLIKPKPEMTKERKEKIVELYITGMSIRDIANKMRASSETIYSIIDSKNIPRRKNSKER